MSYIKFIEAMESSRQLAEVRQWAEKQSKRRDDPPFLYREINSRGQLQVVTARTTTDKKEPYYHRALIDSIKHGYEWKLLNRGKQQLT